MKWTGVLAPVALETINFYFTAITFIVSFTRHQIFRTWIVALLQLLLEMMNIISGLSGCWTTLCNEWAERDYFLWDDVFERNSERYRFSVVLGRHSDNQVMSGVIFPIYPLIKKCNCKTAWNWENPQLLLRLLGLRSMYGSYRSRCLSINFSK